MKTSDELLLENEQLRNRLEEAEILIQAIQADEVDGLVVVRKSQERVLFLEEERLEHLRSELAHLMRVSTMGEMAAGLAHELRQPLTAISTYAHVCSQMVQSAAIDHLELLEAQQQIALQAERAGQIIRRVRSFVDRKTSQRCDEDFNRLIREAVSLARLELRKNAVQVRLDLDQQLPCVHVDAVQIEQVVLNLLRNSIEAMSENDVNDRHLTINTQLTQPGVVRFAIIDSGGGLDPSIMQKGFAPFQTTKPHGLGMGLAISRSIIDAHGGRLWVEANSERGATFCFSLSASVA